jgi:hypothetical protein
MKPTNQKKKDKSEEDDEIVPIMREASKLCGI